MIVVSDTSVISNLLQIEQIELLKLLYRQIIIPQTVYEELCVIPFQKQFIDKQPWIKIGAVVNDEVTKLLTILDKGEAEAIVLCKQLNADLLLIDELRGRNVAASMGIKLIGIIGTLIKAKQQGLINTIKPLLDALQNNANFRINPNLYQFALKQVNEL